MNRWILAAALLSGVTVFLHLIGGGRDVLQPLLALNAGPLLEGYIGVLWHAVTVVLLVNSAALMIAACAPAHYRALVILVAAQYLGYAGLFLYYSGLGLGQLFEMPQWALFIAIALPALWGLRRKYLVGSETEATPS